MEQDVEAVFDEFVEETGSRDLARFLAHLREFGLIEDGVFEDLGGTLAQRKHPAPPPPPPNISSVVPISPREVGPPVARRPKPEDVDDPATDPGVGVGATGDSAADTLENIADPPTAPGAGIPATGATSTADEAAADEAPATEAAVPDAEGGSSTWPGVESAEDRTTPNGTSPSGAFASEASETGARRRRRRRREGGTGAGTGSATGSGRSSRRRPRNRERGGPTTPPAFVPAKIPSGPERYDFIGAIGAGAMGEIKLARDKVLERKVAFKQMSMDIAKQATMASKFNQEAQITAQLDHPNIVPIYNLEVSPDGLGAYTMKLIKGKTLEDFIDAAAAFARANRRRTPPSDLAFDSLIEHFLRVCEAMYYAHCRGVVHRDLKPENLMIGEFGETYVMDWGIAKVFSTEVDEPVIAEAPDDEGDLIIGTPQYMSPEQADGANDDITGQSDQYALGLILFELATLKPAVTGKAPLKIVMRQQDAEKDPLVHITGRRIPFEIKAIIAKATRKQPAQRYANVHELSEDIRRYQRGEAVKARRDNPWQALMRWMGRHRELTLFVLLFAMMSVFLLVVASVTFIGYQSAQASLREGQLTNLLSTVGRQSSLIDGQFNKYEGLLSVVATSAEMNLARPPLEAGDIYLYSDFGVIERQPPDTRPSKRYGTPVSLQSSAFVLAGGVQQGQVDWAMRRLLPVRSQYASVMLRSLKEEAATFTPDRARRAVADKGVPLAWTYIGLENGVYNVFPGHHANGYKHFDPRKTPWYALAASKRGPQWGAPHPDDNGMSRLVLSCATSLHDRDDKLLGVAGIDVTFDYIIEELLEIQGFPDGAESFLVDNKGKIVVRSSRKGQEVRGGGRSRAIRMPTFPVDDVVTQIKALKSGHTVVSDSAGDKLVVYNRMHSLGWYYVVMGDQAELLRTMVE